MRIPHFFKTYSRIGIPNLPHGQKVSAEGVEDGPDYVLSSKFLKNFPDPKVSSFHFSLPPHLGNKIEYQIIYNDTLNFRNLLNEERNPEITKVVIGGDHSVTFASTLSDMEKYGTDFGFIHFDSHGDFNLYKTSPSKNFHGMYLRALIDKFDLRRFDEMAPKKIPTTNLLFIGDLELDHEEKEFFQKSGLISVGHQGMADDKYGALETVEKFLKRFSHVHVSFDVDVFREDLAPATGTPSKDGFTKEPIFDILNLIKEVPSITLDIAEVNPKKKGAQKTIKLSQEIILTLLS